MCYNTGNRKLDVEINPAPTVNVGNDIGSCGFEAVNLSATVSANAGDLNWTSSSGHNGFTDPGNAITSYTPSNGDVANGSVTLTLTASGAGSCDLFQTT